jgi:hypothetical protein
VRLGKQLEYRLAVTVFEVLAPERAPMHAQ